MPDPLILTLALDPGTFAWADALRRAHFPPERNLIPAHVTLFHALPGEEEAAVLAALAEAARGRGPMPLRLGGVLGLGRGTALRVEAPGAAALRAGLAARFAPWLGPQDRQGWRPHLTVQNKVTPEAARRLQAELAPAPPREGLATGLDLWRYRGGPWEAAARVPFGG